MTIPDGYVLVPREPTPEMLTALTNRIYGTNLTSREVAALHYRAMLAQPVSTGWQPIASAPRGSRVVVQPATQQVSCRNTPTSGLPSCECVGKCDFDGMAVQPYAGPTLDQLAAPRNTSRLELLDLIYAALVEEFGGAPYWPARIVTVWSHCYVLAHDFAAPAEPPPTTTTEPTDVR